MKQEYKDKFPKFCNSDNTYDLCLGDDADSILVQNFLQQEKEYETKFFYDFNMLYIEKDYQQQNKIIGCDIDFVINDMRCWGNHVTTLNILKDKFNKNSANLNNTIKKVTAKQNYTDKYAGSTFATVLSYYDFDINKLSEEGKMLLLCIDSHYIGLYHPKFRETQKEWLEVLGYEELYDIILKYKQQNFINLQSKYQINKSGKVWINSDGYLQTNINLDGISNVLDVKITLPKQQFEPFFTEKRDEEYLTFKSKYADTTNINSRKTVHDNIFSYAQTFQNKTSFTYLYKVNPNKDN